MNEGVWLDVVIKERVDPGWVRDGVWPEEVEVYGCLSRRDVSGCG